MRILIVFALLLSLFGCATLSEGVEKPEVNLRNVEVASVTGSAMTLVFNLALQNPNAIDLKADQLSYNLELDGKTFAKGVMDEEIRLKAKGESQVRLPIEVEYQELYSSVTNLLKSGQTKYNLEGAIRFGILSLPFEKAGELDLMKELRARR